MHNLLNSEIKEFIYETEDEYLKHSKLMASEGWEKFPQSKINMNTYGYDGLGYMWYGKYRRETFSPYSNEEKFEQASKLREIESILRNFAIEETAISSWNGTISGIGRTYFLDEFTLDQAQMFKTSVLVLKTPKDQLKEMLRFRPGLLEAIRNFLRLLVASEKLSYLGNGIYCIGPRDFPIVKFNLEPPALD